MRLEIIILGIGLLLVLAAIWPFASLAVFLAGLVVMGVGALMVNARIGASDLKGDRYEQDNQWH